MVKEIGNLIPTDVVDDNEIYVISKTGFDILVYTDTNVEYNAKEKEYDIYLISEQIAPRLISNSAACVIKI